MTDPEQDQQSPARELGEFARDVFDDLIGNACLNADIIFGPTEEQYTSQVCVFALVNGELENFSLKVAVSGDVFGVDGYLEVLANRNSEGDFDTVCSVVGVATPGDTAELVTTIDDTVPQNVADAAILFVEDRVSEGDYAEFDFDALPSEHTPDDPLQSQWSRLGSRVLNLLTFVRRIRV